MGMDELSIPEYLNMSYDIHTFLNTCRRTPNFHLETNEYKRGSLAIVNISGIVLVDFFLR